MPATSIATIKPSQAASLDPGDLMERIIAAGDVSALSPEDRAHYLVRVAESSGLNPLTRPFDLIPGQGGKLVLYANKGATDQLRKIYGLNARLLSQETINGVRVVTVEVTDGIRSEVNIGAVDISKAQGEGLANALMKAITKAKRRATLDWCGLGLLDELEVEGLQAAMAEQRQQAPLRAVEVQPAALGDGIAEGEVIAEAPTAIEQLRIDTWALAKEELGWTWDDFNRARREMKLPPLDKMDEVQIDRFRREAMGEGDPDSELTASRLVEADYAVAGAAGADRWSS